MSKSNLGKSSSRRLNSMDNLCDSSIRSTSSQWNFDSPRVGPQFLWSRPSFYIIRVHVFVCVCVYSLRLLTGIDALLRALSNYFRTDRRTRAVSRSTLGDGWLTFFVDFYVTKMSLRKFNLPRWINDPSRAYTFIQFLSITAHSYSLNTSSTYFSFFFSSQLARLRVKISDRLYDAIDKKEKKKRHKKRKEKRA